MLWKLQGVVSSLQKGIAVVGLWRNRPLDPVVDSCLYYTHPLLWCSTQVCGAKKLTASETVRPNNSWHIWVVSVGYFGWENLWKQLTNPTTLCNEQAPGVESNSNDNQMSTHALVFFSSGRFCLFPRHSHLPEWKALSVGLLSWHSALFFISTRSFWKLLSSECNYESVLMTFNPWGPKA